MEPKIEKAPEKMVETLEDGSILEKNIFYAENANGTQRAIELQIRKKGETVLEETAKDMASGIVLAYNNSEELGKIRDRETFLEMFFEIPNGEEGGSEKSPTGFMPEKLTKETLRKIRGN